jgi:hypothetical protein
MKKLTDEDKENIGFIFQKEITKHRELARCHRAQGKISEDMLKWDEKHADYLEEVWEHLAKILNEN